MTDKVVLLPREWNSPNEPPNNNDDVLIKLENGTISVGYFANEWWRNSDTGKRYDGVVKPDVTGWAHLKQQ